MTNEMKEKALRAYCSSRDDIDIIERCNTCLLDNPCVRCMGDFLSDTEALEEAYEILMSLPDSKKYVEDVINHPSHYNRDGAMESIEEMELIFGKEAVKHFCLCNVWKYRYRAADKNGAEDLKKSDWYMRKYKELCSNE